MLLHRLFPRFQSSLKPRYELSKALQSCTSIQQLENILLTTPPSSFDSITCTKAFQVLTTKSKSSHPTMNDHISKRILAMIGDLDAHTFSPSNLTTCLRCLPRNQDNIPLPLLNKLQSINFSDLSPSDFSNLAQALKRLQPPPQQQLPQHPEFLLRMEKELESRTSFHLFSFAELISLWSIFPSNAKIEKRFHEEVLNRNLHSFSDSQLVSLLSVAAAAPTLGLKICKLLHQRNSLDKLPSNQIIQLARALATCKHAELTQLVFQQIATREFGHHQPDVAALFTALKTMSPCGDRLVVRNLLSQIHSLKTWSISELCAILLVCTKYRVKPDLDWKSLEHEVVMKGTKADHCLLLEAFGRWGVVNCSSLVQRILGDCGDPIPGSLLFALACVDGFGHLANPIVVQGPVPLASYVRLAMQQEQISAPILEELHEEVRQVHRDAVSELHLELKVLIPDVQIFVTLPTEKVLVDVYSPQTRTILFVEENIFGDENQRSGENVLKQRVLERAGYRVYFLSLSLYLRSRKKPGGVTTILRDKGMTML